MGLLKNIELENGIAANYHRIVSVNSITNISTNIEVASYINEDQRLKEEAYQNAQKKNANNEELTEEEKLLLENGINVFIVTKFYQTAYDKDLNVENAYNYLKTLDEFKQAKNV
jgi:microcompartment protein CcmL/EutN